jgi:hypothetical protein
VAGLARPRGRWAFVGAWSFVAIAVVAGYGVLAAVTLQSCAEGLGKDASHEITGRQWCHRATNSRPFVQMVNKAAIGGPAWPQGNALAFGFTFVGGPPTELEQPFNTVRQALDPGVQQSVTVPTNPPTPAEIRIEPQLVPGARAAAHEVDRYCDAQVGPPPTTR